jgi:hypothetical protein
MKVASSWMIANIAFDDALILPHRANPAGLNFRERQGWRNTWSIGRNVQLDIRVAGSVRRGAD